MKARGCASFCFILAAVALVMAWKDCSGGFSEWRREMRAADIVKEAQAKVRREKEEALENERKRQEEEAENVERHRERARQLFDDREYIRCLDEYRQGKQRDGRMPWGDTVRMMVASMSLGRYVDAENLGRANLASLNWHDDDARYIPLFLALSVIAQHREMDARVITAKALDVLGKNERTRLLFLFLNRNITDVELKEELHFTFEQETEGAAVVGLSHLYSGNIPAARASLNAALSRPDRNLWLYHLAFAEERKLGRTHLVTPQPRFFLHRPRGPLDPPG